MAVPLAAEASGGNGALGGSLPCGVHTVQLEQCDERLDGQHASIVEVRDRVGRVELAVEEIRGALKTMRWQLGVIVFVAMAGGGWAGDWLKTLLPLVTP